ncbi:hypothetical protein QYF36_019497 [Acer negundo]|nr:hypothetical protein QYF36_019497 [Acer negundo]
MDLFWMAAHIIVRAKDLGPLGLCGSGLRQRKDKLLDQSSVTNLFLITKYLGFIHTNLQKFLRFSIGCAFDK